MPRARRLYCSPRGRHRGCGRTFSVMPASLLPRRATTAALFFALLCALVSGQSLARARESVLPDFSLSTARRLHSAALRAQSAVRARLLATEPEPPPDTSDTSPLAQTLQHLKRQFPPPACPVAAFQLRHQNPYL